MTEKFVLVDTNAYVRIARDIHPLLGVKFGTTEFVAVLIPEFESEYAKSNRLQNKHSWVNQEQYKKNRKSIVRPSSFQKGEIENARIFIRETARELNLNTGPVDIHAVAIAYIMEIPVLSDDDGLIVLSEEYEVTAWKSLDFLKLLVDNKIIGMAKVRSIYQYWVYLPDKPKNLASDFLRIFGEQPP